MPACVQERGVWGRDEREVRRGGKERGEKRRRMCGRQGGKEVRGGRSCGRCGGGKEVWEVRGGGGGRGVHNMLLTLPRGT
jgi:hypothetical protein